eukprot:8205197-Pyramimonas_sp.AAC.1
MGVAWYTDTVIHRRHQGYLQTKFPEHTSCPLTTSKLDPSFGTSEVVEYVKGATGRTKGVSICSR